MSKSVAAPTTPPISASGFSAGQRSKEREALAEAIRVRDEEAADGAALAQARARARQDLFKANREVEAAEQALTSAREAARMSLVADYVDGNDSDDFAVADAEAALNRAQQRLADLKMIEQELAAHERRPGHSIPNMRVEAAARVVVRAHPTVRRLVQGFDTARRTFQQYEATLIYLAGQRCIPDDLVDVAPRAHATRYADADPSWVKALEALKRDPHAVLPD